jgi:hypothetical protein
MQPVCSAKTFSESRKAPARQLGFLLPEIHQIVRTPAHSARGKRPVTRPMPSRRGALLFLRSSHSARNHVLTLDQSALCAPIGDSHHTNISNLRLARYNRHWDTALRTQRSALLLATKLNNVVSVFAVRRVRDHASCPRTPRGAEMFRHHLLLCCPRLPFGHHHAVAHKLASQLSRFRACERALTFLPADQWPALANQLTAHIPRPS